MTKTKTFLLASVAWSCLVLPASADDAAILARLDAMQAALDAQNREIAAQRAKIESQSQEISTLRRSLGTQSKPAVAPAAAPAPAYKNAQRLKEQDEPVVSYTNGRPMISSPDGRFTFALRGLAQFDMGYFDQSESARRLAATNGPSLSSGANFRRAALGMQGQFFGDWSYLFNYDFGGSSGNESQGRVQSVYLQYDGLKPFAFRIGAYPPPASLEDSTSATDTIFMERNAPADAARAIAGADGRDAISAIYAGPCLRYGLFRGRLETARRRQRRLCRASGLRQFCRPGRRPHCLALVSTRTHLRQHQHQTRQHRRDQRGARHAMGSGSRQPMAQFLCAGGLL